MIYFGVTVIGEAAQIMLFMFEPQQPFFSPSLRAINNLLNLFMNPKKKKEDSDRGIKIMRDALLCAFAVKNSLIFVFEF